MFMTSRTTLTSTDCMLRGMFSGNFALERLPDSSIFIDRDGTFFRYILNFLRDGELTSLPESHHELQQLLIEAKYYSVSKLV